MQALKEAGCTIVLDSAWSDMLSLEWYYDAFRMWIFYTELHGSHENNRGGYTGTGIGKAVRAFENPIVKNGNAGCLYKENKELHIIEPLPVRHVDSTGAGDAFAAGFMYGLYYGYDLGIAYGLEISREEMP